MDLRSLKVKLFCDSADLNEMLAMRDAGLVKGFTCNPSLCRKAGVKDYLGFARRAAALTAPCPMSLEVIADEPNEIQRQAELLASIGNNVFVKVPIVRTNGESNGSVIMTLAASGMQLNITACFTTRHLEIARTALATGWPHTKSFYSVFAGRIADTGRHPQPAVTEAVTTFFSTPTRVIWASVREPLNIMQADTCACDIITVFPEMLRRLERFGRDLDEFARETSEMFFRDAVSSGFTL